MYLNYTVEKPEGNNNNEVIIDTYAIVSNQLHSTPGSTNPLVQWFAPALTSTHCDLPGYLYATGP